MRRFRWLSAERFLILLGLVGWTAGCNASHGLITNKSGMLQYNQGNYAAARGEFQRALIDQPTNADYAHNLGASLKKTGDVPGAERAYRHALSLDPSHQPAHHSLAMLMVEQGRSQEAKDLLQQWADVEPYRPESHIELAWMQREVSDTASAEQSLRNALRVSPNNEIATAQLGDLYRASGQSDRAVAMYQRSLHANWFQPQVQSRLASLGSSPVQMGRPAGPMINGANAMAGSPGQPQMAMSNPSPMYNGGVIAAPLVTSPAVIGANGWVPAGTTSGTRPVGSVPALHQANFDPAHTDTANADVPEVSAQ